MLPMYNISEGGDIQDIIRRMSKLRKELKREQ
jgi:hypothetical protein